MPSDQASGEMPMILAQANSYRVAARFICWLAVCTAGAPVGAEVPAHRSRPIDFVRTVQPILRMNCHRCHGSKNRKAGLQLNRRESAYGVGDSAEPILVKGRAAASLLIKRLVDNTCGDLMPLDGEPLSRADVDLLRRWIDEGAVWPDEVAEPKHWAYQPIVRPRVPDGDLARSALAPIDQFIRQRLSGTTLAPNREADRARLIRRVSLSLIGLPPTPGQVDAFLSDRSANAYEKIVDRLLASPRYGERWAVPWLDLTRYADSNGFQADQLRDNWAYRDWVIRALNADMPFDQFVIDQLAGDLRPQASLNQRIATGFHRMTTCNVEAGVDPEANRINQVIDRVNTTATVFLGTTLECAQCHDHKYDPFTQTDYYRFFAYFNNTPLEVKHTKGVTWDFYGPSIELPMDQSSQLEPSTTLVMEEMPQPRETFVLARGEYDRPTEKVLPGTPAALARWPGLAQGGDRLDLARWLTSPENPLLARVTVNRWWGELLGVHIVGTAEDFGTQADDPSHPQLLDWLAAELIESGWSMKHIHKLVVMSDTFKQSAKITSESLAADPENRLLARGPRFRLSAELLRDNGLAISGLLSTTMYGPPIMPHQPSDIWRSVGRNQPKWKAAEDENRFRRGVYVICKRAAPYPSFITFDAPDRSSCTVNRSRTNTPLQALTLLNDPAYAEMALALADRVLTESPTADDDVRMNYAIRLALARNGTPYEIARLQKLLDSQRQTLKSAPELVAARTEASCAAFEAKTIDKTELAAWFAVANALLNLDETVTN